MKEIKRPVFIRTMKTKDLRPVEMTPRMLMFRDSDERTYYATKRVANDVLSNSVEEVTVMERIFINKEGIETSIMMLATPSPW